MIHNHNASLLALARTVLSGVDRSKIETPVQTATLVLLLETLVELGTPVVNDKLETQAQRTVVGHLMAGGDIGRQS